jgi:hypothetical protein
VIARPSRPVQPNRINDDAAQKNDPANRLRLPLIAKRSRWGSGLAIAHREEILNWRKHSDHSIAAEGIPEGIRSAKSVRVVP